MLLKGIFCSCNAEIIYRQFSGNREKYGPKASSFFNVILSSRRRIRLWLSGYGHLPGRKRNLKALHICHRWSIRLPVPPRIHISFLRRSRQRRSAISVSEASFTGLNSRIGTSHFLPVVITSCAHAVKITYNIVRLNAMIMEKDKTFVNSNDEFCVFTLQNRKNELFLCIPPLTITVLLLISFQNLHEILSIFLISPLNTPERTRSHWRLLQVLPPHWTDKFLVHLNIRIKPCGIQHFRSFRIFSRDSGMNACPPNPGSTLMIRNISALSR